jgi:hypothetical protein
MQEPEGTNLDELFERMKLICSRIEETTAGPEKEELRLQLRALSRMHFLLWKDHQTESATRVKRRRWRP